MKSHKPAKIRTGKCKLPKHILENIKHPVLRQAWMLELAAASQHLSPGKSIA